ncbi:MAG TPA: hypothetical protein VF360_07845 [Candidatus Methanoperedens sp.]
MKVKFLVDECTGKRLSNLLNVAGYDTIFVGISLSDYGLQLP